MYGELPAGVQGALGGSLPSALIIERDWSLRSTIAELLARYCPCVAAPSNGLRAYDHLTEEPPAVLVLGEPLPDLDPAVFTRLVEAITHGATRVVALNEGPEPDSRPSPSDEHAS